MALWAKLKSSLSRAWVDRTRLKIADEDKVLFFIKDEGLQIQKLKVQNISIGGIGLLASDFPNAELSRNIEGELRIVSNNKPDNVSPSSTFKILASIVHKTETTVGLRFNSITPELEFALEQYFKVELLGSRLSLVDKKFLKTENDILPIWLTDGRSNEIYILAEKNGAISFHLSFLGHYVEGAKDKKIRVGQITNKVDSEDLNRYKASDLIEMSPKAEETSLRLARDFVSNARGIDAGIMAQVLLALKA